MSTPSLVPVTAGRAAFAALAFAGALAAQTHPARAAHPFSEHPAARAQGGVARPAHLPPPATNMIMMPQALPRAMGLPAAAFWEQRDMLGAIRNSARQGYIPTVPVDAATPAVTDFTYFPAGWKAYAFAVPQGERLHVRLHHAKEGWFRLVMVNRWGSMTMGMLQNRIPTGNPEVSYKNLYKSPQVVYVIVDDPGWMSSKTDPFTLKVERSWDPAKVPMPNIPTVLGVFATKQLPPDVEERADVPPAPVPAPAAPKS